MDPRTCPYCGLRFAFQTELDWHLRQDHREHVASAVITPEVR